jgi:hypothetical protein
MDWEKIIREELASESITIEFATLMRKFIPIHGIPSLENISEIVPSIIITASNIDG